MGMLSGGAAAFFGELFESLYLPARVTSQGIDYTTSGDLQRTSGERGCRAQVDSATEEMRGTEGYTDTDRAIYVLASTLEGELNSGHCLEMLEGPDVGKMFNLAPPITRDPASAYWLCRGVRVRVGPRG